MRTAGLVSIVLAGISGGGLVANSLTSTFHVIAKRLDDTVNFSDVILFWRYPTPMSDTAVRRTI